MPKNQKKKRTSNEIKRDREWLMNDDNASIPTTFDSQFTNMFGERWWCLMVDDHLVFWGDDVGGTATSKTVEPTVTPWILNDPEKLWFSANLLRLKEVLKMKAYLKKPDERTEAHP